MGKSRKPRRAGAVVEALVETVDGGLAELIPDRDRARAWTLLIDGAPQSHVDLDDPAYLSFEYQRRLGHVIDLVAPPGRPVHAVHLGGGALTLARYVAATRPRSTQQVVERDAPLVQLVRRAKLPLAPTARIRVRSTDAREGLAKARTSSYTALQKKASEMISGAKSLTQFMDRDSRPDFSVDGDAARAAELRPQSQERRQHPVVGRTPEESGIFSVSLSTHTMTAETTTNSPEAAAVPPPGVASAAQPDPAGPPAPPHPP
ncbi:hypothetical protein SALBM311S_12169 [Streptomyces alboniger]